MVSANQNEGFAHKGLSLGTSPKYPNPDKEVRMGFSCSQLKVIGGSNRVAGLLTLSPLSRERRSKGWKKKELDLRATR